MRSGFLARAGLALGPLAISFGYGGGLDEAPDPVVLVLLSDGALTEILASLDARGNEEAAELALVTVSDQPKTDVRVTHAPLTVIETIEET